MRTFLNDIKNETLDEIKTSLKNLWQQMIQLSEFFQYSFLLILKRKCLVRASRVRSGESGTPSTIIYIRWSSRRYELGCDTPVGLSHLFHYVPIMVSSWNFSGVVTNDRSDVYAKGQGQWSKVKITEVKTQLSCFRTINSSLISHMAMKWCTKLDVV